MIRDEMEFIARWIVQNAGSGMVPCDEGNSEGLVYNMLAVLRNGWEHDDWWTYTPENERKVEEWRRRASAGLPIFDQEPADIPATLKPRA